MMAMMITYLTNWTRPSSVRLVLALYVFLGDFDSGAPAVTAIARKLPTQTCMQRWSSALLLSKW
jgi:hypothetical protein